MKIEFIDLKKQYQSRKNELDGAIARVLDKGIFVLGEEVENFSREFARFCGAKHCIAVASGTDALYLSLKALGVGKGDEVITAPNSFVATAMAISLTEAKPVFIDINPLTYNIDAAKIEEKITPKTKAIIPVHLYGQPADMDEVFEIASKYNLKILEDACQAHGAEYKNKKTGTLGDIAAFSFGPPKPLGAYGDGGAVVTNDDALAEKVSIYKNYGAPKRDNYLLVGINSRLDALQAAILKVKLKYLDKWNEMRRNNAKLYDRYLEGVAEITRPMILSHNRSAFHLYVVRARNRDSLAEYLKTKQIPALIHYPRPIHLQSGYAALGYKKSDFPVTERAAEEILSLPIFPELLENEIGYIAENIKRFYGL